MKRVVLDASALAEYLLRSERGLAVEAVLVDRDNDLHAPALCDIELMAVLRRGLRAGLLTEERSAQAIEDLRDLPITRHGHLHLLEMILGLRRNFSAYDATYVALAERLDADLLTGDRRLGRAVAQQTALRVLADQ